MAEEIIQARVWTKVDTLENWNNNPLLLGPGEIALVTTPSGIPMNMKWGDKTTRKRFSDLPFAIAYDQGQFVAVSGTTLPASDGNVHYSLVGEGTYTRAGQSDIVVPVGDMGIIVDDGTNWSLGSTVTLPVAQGTDVLEDELIPKGKAVMQYSPSLSDVGIHKIIQGVNLISELIGTDKTNATLWGNGFFTSNGAISTASANDWGYTRNFYDILEGSYDCHLTISGSSCLIFYDEDKNFIGFFQNTSSPAVYNFTLSAPANSRYFRFGHNFTAEPTTSLLKVEADDVYTLVTSDVFLKSTDQRDSDKYFEFLNLDTIAPGTSFLPSDFLTNYDKYWQRGFISNIGEPTDITWNPTDGFGWSNNIKAPIPLIKGGIYRVESTISVGAHCMILNSKLQVETTISETSPGVTVSGNKRIFNVDLSNATENKYFVFSAHDYDPDLYPSLHQQWFDLMSLKSVDEIFVDEFPSFTATPINYKHSLTDADPNGDIKAYNQSGAPITQFGLDNTIYEVPVPIYNGKARIKFEVQFLEDINIADGNYASTFSVLKNYNRSFRGQIHKRDAAIGTDNFSTFGSVNSQNIRSVALWGVHYSPDNRLNNTFTSSHNFPWGNFMFGVRYNGDLTDSANRDVCLTISATQFRVWKETGNVTLFSYTITPTTTVLELYNALKSQSFLDLKINTVSDRLAKDLLKISKINLSSEYFNSDGSKYWDSGICWIPLGISERWHTVEMILQDGKVYYSFNGFTWETASQYNFASPNTKMYIGGELGSAINLKNRVRNLHITTEDLLDAEVVNYSLNYPAVTPKVYSKKVVSNYNPLLYMFVGHDVLNTTDDETLSDPMHCSTDRLERLFQHLKKTGYVPVTIEQVEAWKRLDQPLPKRCFVPIFDDYRWRLFAYTEIRKCFERYNVKPVLALITSPVNNPSFLDQPQVGSYVYNPSSFFRQVNIDGWSVQSHTKDHRYLRWDKTSEILDKLNDDALDAYQAGCKTNALIYPQGNIRNSNLYNVANSVFKIGIMTADGNKLPEKQNNDFYMFRVELGQRNPLQNLLDSIV